MILMVSYDLHNDKKYDAVIDVLESYDEFHVHGSTWLLDAEDDAGEVKNRLKEAGDEDDSFLVTRLGGASPRWALWNVPGLSDWLKRRTF